MEIRLAIRFRLKTTTIYLQQHIPVSNPILRDLQCLRPAARKEPSDRATIWLHDCVNIWRRCARLTASLTRSMQNGYCTWLPRKWMLFHQWLLQTYAATETVSKVMDVTGGAMFPNLSFLAKACLTISYGNAVAERGFSVNTALLTKDRLSLEETTIQTVRVVKEAIRLWHSYCCASYMVYD